MAITPTVDPWIQFWQPKLQARLRLFCFPYAGGGASIFRTWSEILPPQIEVCPVQLPGRESRLLEAPFSHLFSLIEPLTQALLPYLDMPCAFFGHSMGALISFELVRYLRRQHGLSPVHLLVSARRAPQLIAPDPPIHHLPEPQFVEELRRLKGTPEEVLQTTELLQLLIPFLRADFALCETYLYTPGEALTCPVSVFGGLQDEEVSRDMLTAWREQTRGSFKLRLFVGDHFFLHAARASLLQALLQDLFNYLH
ncbi:MAG: thioesterase II family protein [Ktedonobacteraceae bacterium]